MEYDRKLVAAGVEMRSLTLGRNRGHEDDKEVEEVWTTEVTPKKHRKSTRAIAADVL